MLAFGCGGTKHSLYLTKLYHIIDVYYVIIIVVTQSQKKKNKDLFPKVDTAETNNKLQTAQAS